MFKKVVKGLLIIVAIFVVFIGAAVIYLTTGLEKQKEVSISDVKIEAIEDGIYHGEFKNGRWTNAVEVEIKDHKLFRIEVSEDVSISDASLKNQILDKVIKEQTLQIDTISGATATTKAYVKSIENALLKEGGSQ